MSITRSPRRITWTQVDNEVINDERIPADTLGMFVYLLSKPDNWNVNATHLQTRFNVGRQKVYRMLRDLQTMSYASYTKYNDGTTDWIVSEHRMDTPYAQNQHLPYAEKPDEANHHHIVNTERAVKTEVKPYDQTEFDRWWMCYPKKVGKKDALRAFKKIKVPVDKLIADTKNRAENDRTWVNGYTPNPATYLRGERFNDEVQQVTKEQRLPRNDEQLAAYAVAQGLHAPGCAPQNLRNMSDYRKWIQERLS